MSQHTLATGRTCNIGVLGRLLEEGVEVMVVDRNISTLQDIKEHSKISSTKCTALNVDERVDKQPSLRGIVGVCGELLSYPLFNSSDLFNNAAKYSRPFSYLKEETDVIATLTNSYQHDLEYGLSINPYKATEKAAMVILPDAAWARRISGVLGNELTNRHPNRMHLILSPKSQSGDAYQVSIRAAKNNPAGADTLAKKFGGGGRERAAGIDRLLSADINTLWAEFT